MKAALYRETGPATVLTLADVEPPVPVPGEVLVRLRVSGINPTDWKTRAGLTSRAIHEFQVPHLDGAGVIEAVGPGVDPARVGERVWVWFAGVANRWGTAAELTVVPAGQAMPLPEGASFELGAMLGVPALTAAHALLADGPAGGKTVLVAGGAGAVGHFCIELAKRAGARVVATVSGPEKAALAAQSGADLVVNYRDQDAARRISAFGAPDRIVELALSANLELDLAVAAQGASIVVYAAEPDDPALPVRECMNAGVRLQFFVLYRIAEEARQRAAAEVAGALADGALTELPVTRFPLAEIAAAQEAVEQGALGKVIVEP